MNKVIKQNIVSFVRDGNQPPTLQAMPAAPRFLTDTLSLMKPMKNKTTTASLLALLLCAAGCQTPVAVTADYGLPGTNITATVSVGTNAVTLGGSYQTGATNIGGTVTVDK